MDLGAAFERQSATNELEALTEDVIASDSDDDEALLRMTITPSTATTNTASSGYRTANSTLKSQKPQRLSYLATPDLPRKAKPSHPRQSLQAEDDIDDVDEVLNTPQARAKGSRAKRSMEDLEASDDDDIVFQAPPTISKPTPSSARTTVATPVGATASSTIPSTGSSSLLSRLQVSHPKADAVQSHRAHDSVKKLKKVKRGGLAEQCQRLAAYERSEQNLYRHYRARGDTVQSSERALCLEVLMHDVQQGLPVLGCRVLSGHSNTFVSVMMASSTDYSVLSAGSCIQIDAPWRELQLQAGQPKLILGPLFWHVRVNGPSSQEREEAEDLVACEVMEETEAAMAKQPQSPVAQSCLKTVPGTRPSPHKQPQPGRISPDPSLPKLQLFQ